MDTDEPKTLVVEIKGSGDPEAMLKAHTMQNVWVRAVSGLNAFGRWRGAEFWAINEFKPDLDRAICDMLASET
ncbi:hypothetical protein [Salipiger bermudensis]|uniref:hypothetical protein n=1 Tax=Salipiger bermudensis TaxID=344736 RepID=UPI001CD21F3D|nr:hypothetical protein [Salipiger bermudensis]MCA1287909.1 hypothetical protein [Salipiger bermudensis]